MLSSRSMVLNAEEFNRGSWPKTNRTGRLVGPRPPVPRSSATSPGSIAVVRPGLTCLWQDSPERYRISCDEWMRLDLS
jgi:hypothetical protein